MSSWNNTWKRGNMPARPRNLPTALKRFMDWNRWGIGDEQTSSRTSVYWHRDKVFYRGWQPVARCLHAAGQGVMMVKLYDQGLGLWHDACKQHVDLARVFNVHDICVWGPGKGLMMPDDDFIDMMRLQWLSKGSYVVESANGYAYDRCAKWVQHEGKVHGEPPEGKVWPAKGTPVHTDFQIDGRIRMLNDMADDYHRCRDVFNLDWEDYPKFTLINLYLKVIRDRAAVYASNAPRRERALARKDGIRALELAAE